MYLQILSKKVTSAAVCGMSEEIHNKVAFIVSHNNIYSMYCVQVINVQFITITSTYICVALGMINEPARLRLLFSGIQPHRGPLVLELEHVSHGVRRRRLIRGLSFLVGHELSVVIAQDLVWPETACHHNTASSAGQIMNYI